MLALQRLAHGMRRLRLEAVVQRRLGHRDLRVDAVLVVDDRQRRAVVAERDPEEADELRIVGEADRGRPRVREVRGDARVLAVRVEREHVHDRLRAAACAVGGAEVDQEAGRRVRLPWVGRIVAAMRRQCAAEDVDLRRDSLQRVVALGQQCLIRGRGGVRAVGSELRKPVTVQVGLVADDEVADPGQIAGERSGVRGELPAVILRERRGAAAEVRDAEHHRDAVEPRRRFDVLQLSEVGRGRLRLARRPDLRDADCVETGERQEIHLGLRGHERGLPHGILGRSDQHARAACRCCSGREQCAERDCR